MTTATQYCTGCGYPIEDGKCDCSSGVPRPESTHAITTPHWRVPMGETPFWAEGEEWTYVWDGKDRYGYLRHRDDLVYDNYRAPRQVI